MSRSNGPAAHSGTPPGAWPQQRPAAQTSAQAAYEQDLAAWNAQQQGRWPAQAPPTQAAAQPAPQGYAPPSGYAADPRTAPPAYHYPAGNEGHDPYSRPTLGGRETTAPPSAYGHQPYAATPSAQPYPQQSYAPEFDPYTPPMPQSSAASNYGVQPGYGHAAQPQYAAQYAPQPSHEPLSSLQPRASVAAEPSYPAPELRGAHYDQNFDQWAQPGFPPAHGHAPAQPAHDPRGYDLGGYAPATSEPNAYRQPMSLEPAQSEWGGADGQYDAYGQPQPFPQQQGHPHARPGEGGQIEPAYQQDEAGGEYELDEPPAGRRWGLIAAALVGAIAVGGGMTYGYNMLAGSNATTAAAPVVKNMGTPTKVKPAEPGGKQFAHTDSKIMGRLNDQSAAAPATTSAAAADSDPSGARKVQTMVIGRDGSIVPPAAPAAAALPQPVSVPGMTIVDGFGGRPPAAALSATAAPTPARPVVVNPPTPPAAAAPARPTVLARAAPATVSDAAPVVATKPTPAPAAPKVAVPKKVAAAATAPAAAAPSGGNGFVAVLASVPASSKSSMDALKQFADMQQKYGSALVNKTPEVREANLGDKGTYHRLLVGPPGSREQAGQVCGQLKAAGYTSCWVTAY